MLLPDIFNSNARHLPGASFPPQRKRLHVLKATYYTGIGYTNTLLLNGLKDLDQLLSLKEKYTVAAPIKFSPGEWHIGIAPN